MSTTDAQGSFTPELLRHALKLHGKRTNEPKGCNVEIGLARASDMDGWMELVDRVKEGFPGLETSEALAEHRNTALEFVSTESAICAKEQDRIAGALLFSKKKNMLCFLAVDPAYRRRHIAERMVSHMLRCMDSDRDIVVTTYREGVPEGIAARAFYQKMGFTEGRLMQEFGSPVQEFVLKRGTQIQGAVQWPTH